MFEGIIKLFKKFSKNQEEEAKSKDTAKERLHLVLMQDRANISADFLEMMKQEIIDVIKKYIEVDEKEIDVKLTNKTNEDGSVGAPALYANIPISKIKNENKEKSKSDAKSEKKDDDIDKTKEIENNEIDKANIIVNNKINEKKDDEESKRTQNSTSNEDKKNDTKKDTKSDTTSNKKEDKKNKKGSSKNTKSKK